MLQKEVRTKRLSGSDSEGFWRRHTVDFRVPDIRPATARRAQTAGTLNVRGSLSFPHGSLSAYMDGPKRQLYTLRPEIQVAVANCLQTVGLKPYRVTFVVGIQEALASSILHAVNRNVIPSAEPQALSFRRLGGASLIPLCGQGVRSIICLLWLTSCLECGKVKASCPVHCELRLSMACIT